MAGRSVEGTTSMESDRKTHRPASDCRSATDTGPQYVANCFLACVRGSRTRMNHIARHGFVAKILPECLDGGCHGRARCRIKLYLDRNEFVTGLDHNVHLCSGRSSPEVDLRVLTPMGEGLDDFRQHGAVSMIGPPMGPEAACSGSFRPVSTTAGNSDTAFLRTVSRDLLM